MKPILFIVILMNLYVAARVKQERKETITLWRFNKNYGADKPFALNMVEPVEFPLEFESALPPGVSKNPNDFVNGGKLCVQVTAKQFLSAEQFSRAFPPRASRHPHRC